VEVTVPHCASQLRRPEEGAEGHGKSADARDGEQSHRERWALRKQHSDSRSLSYASLQHPFCQITGLLFCRRKGESRFLANDEIVVREATSGVADEIPDRWDIGHWLQRHGER
jgi:hypothetical protein